MARIEWDHIYTSEDLEHPDILQRELRPLYNARIGMKKLDEVRSVHIKVRILKALFRGKLRF
jgi:hypothetical protein